CIFFFFSSRRRHTRSDRDWSSDVCSSDLGTHFIPLCFDHGISEVQSASLLAVIGAFDFVGTLASGWLSDRVSSRVLLFWYYGLRSEERRVGKECGAWVGRLVTHRVRRQQS